MRVSEEQTWPERMHSAGEGAGGGPMSTSSRMTAADLPPSSRVQRAIRSPQIEAMRRPAAVEPVKEILSTRGSRTSSSDTSRSAVTTLSTPAGRPTASATSARMYPSPGASGEAFRTTVHPASSAGRGLVADQAQRCVPRDDRPDDADRFADEQSELPRRTARPAPRTGSHRRGGVDSKAVRGGRRRRGRGSSMPDSRVQIWPRSSAARRAPRRCAAGSRPARAWVSRVQGPSSNASRAASPRGHVGGLRLGDTEVDILVSESVTTILASEEGATHAPPMKNRSGVADRRGVPGSLSALPGDGPSGGGRARRVPQGPSCLIVTTYPKPGRNGRQAALLRQPWKPGGRVTTVAGVVPL